MAGLCQQNFLCRGRESEMRVSLIAASTICGRIGPNLMGSSVDRAFLEEMRGATDASIIGAGTLRSADPEMRGPGGVLPQKRIRCIVTASGKIPVAGKKLFQHRPPPVVFAPDLFADELRELVRDHGEVVGLAASDTGISLRSVLQFLKGRGVGSVLIEGGGGLNYAALAEQVVDEIFLTLMPAVSGQQDGVLFCHGKTSLPSFAGKLHLVSCRAERTGEVFLHYQVKR
jgi:riboflavin biosynthesis pyrimidine reductase